MGNFIWGQKILQLEKAGSFKRWKYYKGDEIKFSLVSDPNSFYLRTIHDLDPGSSSVFLGDIILQVDSIAAVAMIGSNEWAKKWSKSMLFFSASLAGYSLIDFLYSNRKPEAFHYIVGGASFVLSHIFRWLIPERRRKIGRSHRLLVLDLTFTP